MGPLSMEEQRFYDGTTRTPYKSLLLLGKGGFAKCYKVRNDLSHELTALKVIDKKNMNENQYAKVQREIMIHRGLNHPHIVRLESTFEDDSNVYIVMELCREKSLLNLINDSSRISEVDAQHYMRGVVSAVTFLLQNDIIHRDIKPGNILLKENGNRTVVKLADFGLACMMREVSGVSVSGTPNYLAPEILARKGHSSASEAWSLGCLLFCMVVGTPPFDSSSIQETYRRISAGEYKYPAHLPLSYAVITLIDGLLRVRVSDRLGVNEIASSQFMRSTPRSPSHHSAARSCSVVASRTPSRASYSALHAPSSPTRASYPSSSPSPPPPPPARGMGRDRGDDLLPPYTRSDSYSSYNPAPSIVPPSTCGFDTTRSRSHLDSSSLSISPPLPTLSLFPDLDIHSSTLASLVSGVRSISKVRIEPPLHISKWVDYSNKYGFGCLLSDGTTSVKFNTGEIVALRTAETGIYAASSSSRPIRLNKDDGKMARLMDLARSYRIYMDTQLARAAVVDNMKGNTTSNDLSTVYITHYSKKQNSLMVVLSDGTTQINFTSEHFKVIISPDSSSSSLLSFIDPSGSFSTYRTSTLSAPLSSTILSLLRSSNQFISDEVSYLRTFHNRSHPLTTSC